MQHKTNVTNKNNNKIENKHLNGKEKELMQVGVEEHFKKDRNEIANRGKEKLK